MYAQIDDPSLSQGDIINNVVLSYITDISSPQFLLQNEKVEKDLTQPFDSEEELAVLAQAFKSQVLVIAPNCNIDNDDFICVARIFPLTHEIDPGYSPDKSPKKKAKHLKDTYQRAGVEPVWYYLQEAPDLGFPKSIASLLELHTIRKTPENLEYLVENRILRLTEEAVGDLQYRIGFFFGRYVVTTDNYMLTPEERALFARPAEDEAAEAAARPADE
ncbi:MAG: hypothetical protein ACR2HX_19705 [Pyrinomonadaceae bacterium]